ncbi:putative bifunctional diguanylate cyclase/phosphodiesterase [Phreatobacter oligotrophus]|uniref:Diguanylate cyclase (GGDEF)-like protein n=1 Tax=Phreatobacter oligotrophus TaxID=1122261 RepID=A0A2T4Z156_9HYPH|nr:EAL domain-containing protein [Phreatobacter oligotrophus]PTM53460.1 diguanylate cyclase (GGDEF)-like protein [Phreatobacter oligotrophus]
MGRDTPRETYGRGLNSIPLRFALLSFVVALAAGGPLSFVVLTRMADDQPVAAAAVIALGMAAISAGMILLAARKLTSTIAAIQRSTDAVAAGRFDEVLDVDCACEIGGLAESFRRMVQRVNASIVRMNVLAHTDLVTGLPNRAVVTHVLNLAAGRAQDGCEGALFFIDLDGFKAVNDTYGHRAGDELLRQVSRRIVVDGFGRQPEDLASCTNALGELIDACPDDLVVARFAGDEFVALLPGAADMAVLRARADAILAALRRPFRIAGHDIVIGASIGIARAPDDAPALGELISLADFAMYVAKARGKNTAVFFDQDLRDLVREQAELEADLRLAVETQAMELHYQPKVSTTTGDLVGVEALLRWTDPKRGAVAPSHFVPLAEKVGLMEDLGRFVVTAAVRQQVIWSAEGLDLPVAINVSPRQLEDPSFVPELLDLVTRSGVRPELIEVEVTETALISDYAETAAKVRLLRQAGLAVAIDDFGVGYSNLSHLSRLSATALKIDRSLIERVTEDEKAEAIIRAAIDMARALGLTSVAEGIETPQQAAFLASARCDVLQGFLYARPMPPADLLAWLAARRTNPVADLTDGLRQALS